jgi:hypothetical protein
METQTYDDLQQSLATAGPAAAIEQLCTVLRDKKDYANLFYALLLKKRVELGVSPIPTGPAQDLPAELHESYEETIRQAGRLVGGLYLQEGDLVHAWAYFRMLGEPEPVRAALENAQPGESENCQQLVDIALHQGVHPKKGFDLLLSHFGICSAITTISGQEFPHGVEVRDYCIKRLVRALYDELCDRLRGEITRQEGKEPQARSVPALIAGRDWLFQDDFYHVDVSHLSAVVQMSVHLGPSEELTLARQLCTYGQKLSPRFQYASDPPFENMYRDYGIHLAVQAGENVEAGLAHFRQKAAEADPETVGTYPAEVLVNLLLRVNRPREALQEARRYLARRDERQLTCPSIVELCQRTGDYATLTEVAREQDNPVYFVAGLVAAKR